MAPKKLVSFHNRIRMLRTERGISRKQLAEATGIHPQTVGYIERREYNLSIDLALKIGAVLGVSLDAMFSPDPFEPLSNAQLVQHSQTKT